MLKRSILVLLLFWMAFQADGQVKLFNSQDVKLLPSIFNDAAQTDLDYLLTMNIDRLLAPYLREAGLEPKAESYPNWENTGLDGHIGGHYLSALAMMYAATADQRVGNRLTYMLAELQRCQKEHGNGYIGGVPGGTLLWNDVASGKIQAGSFELNKKWVPLYNIHKIFGGLRDVFQYTGNLQAKEMLISYSNWFVWLTAKLTDQQIQQLLISEHGGINEVLADVYAITGDRQYLDLAYKFSQKIILDPLQKGVDQLNGLHANTQIPKVIGFKRIADLNKDSAYNAAANFFWTTVVNHRSIANGGNSVREHFNPINDFSTMISSVEGPETCNSYNMLKLTNLIYQEKGLPSIVDYYEKTLYNHILSSQHPNGGFVYFTPIRPGHYRVYSQPETSFWCCVGSGLENHAKYNELIYAHQTDTLYLNLFIPSALNWQEKGLRFVQETNFPDSEKTTFKLVEGMPTGFTLMLRYPSWVASGKLKVLVNGKLLKINARPGTNVAIKRLWKKGDHVAVVLPMHTRTERLPDNSNYLAVLHGPILLAAKTDTAKLTGLFANDSRMGHIARGEQYPLQDMPLFASDKKDVSSFITAVKGKALTFSAPDLIYPSKFKNLELIPFYKLHDTRYMIYWQQVSKEELTKLRSKQAEVEQVKAELVAITIDMVYPGEQQPESDHYFTSEQTSTGTFNGRQWRKAKGWFGYEFTDPSYMAGSLRVTYHGKDTNKSFKILVNELEIAKVSLIDKGDAFYEVDYQIPTSALMRPSSKVNVKFVANTNSETASIYELRLLKKK
jgi:DUF1680 family protein